MVKVMSNNEKISSLVDGESIERALIPELENDKEAHQKWKNYHLIGDVMRGDAPATANWDIAERVAVALQDEPVHSTVVKPMVESQPLPVEAKKSLPRWLTQFSQVAVAACVSFVVILGVQQYGGSVNGQAPSVADIPVLQTIPVAGSVEPVSLTRESVRSKAEENNTATRDDQMAEQRHRINTFLQDYELQLRLNQVRDNSIVESEIK